MIAVEVWTGRHALMLRRAKRCSQRDFAAWLGVSQRSVCKWEDLLDGVTPRPESQQILDMALARSSDDEKSRFTAQLAASTAEDRVPTMSSPEAVGRSGPANRAATAIQPSSADSLTEIYDRLLVEYAALDNAAGPHSAVDMITRHADLLAQGAENESGAMRQALIATAARYAEFAGWLHQDAGDLVCAVGWTEKALSLAHASGDASLVAYTLMRRSNQAVEQRKGTMALGLAEAALGSPGASTPRVRALGLRQRAAGLALSHDTRGSLDAFAEARDCIATDPAWNPLTGYCTLPYLDAEAAVCQLLLGRDQAAVELLTPAIASWPGGYTRDRAFYQAHLAVALIGIGLLDDGLAHAREAAQTVRAIHSARTIEQLRIAAQRLAERGKRDESAALREGLEAGLRHVGASEVTLSA